MVHLLTRQARRPARLLDPGNLMEDKMQYVVMTSSAKMPRNCWGRYRNVAIVAYDGPNPPKIIADTKTAKVVRHYGPQSVGSTERCAYNRTLAAATAEAQRLSAAAA